MRGLSIVVLTALVVAACGTYIPHQGTKPVFADRNFLLKQKVIFEVLAFVNQKTFFEEYSTIAQSYSIADNLEKYSNVEAVKEFLSTWEEGYLPRGQVFAVSNDRQREEAIALFHVFYYAKDWETFQKSMVWARDHVNEGLFVYALTVAVLHRDDMQGIILPAPYEIFPYYFVNSEVIQQAYEYKMTGFEDVESIEGRTVVIPANYSGWYVQTNPEQKISYFTEDVGLNSYYYYFHSDYPSWLGGEEYGLKKDRRGELYLYTHQKLLARYYLERLSNGLGEIPTFSWGWPIETGYWPSLQHANGLEFPARPERYDFHDEDNVELLQQVEDYERRIRDAIDYGFLILPDNKRIDLRKPEAIDQIGNLIQSNEDSPNTRYYRHVLLVARTILGGRYESTDDYKVAPSTLELLETSMRDPVFYQLYKRIGKFYSQFKEHLDSYTQEELSFPGVKIESAQIDQLVTYFDSFDVDLTNALYWSKKEYSQKEQFHHVVARQQRLNHQPFSYRLTVQSDKQVESVVRVFLGPKYDERRNELDLDENRENFIEIDKFSWTLTAGQSVIERKSQDFTATVDDRTSAWSLHKKVEQALQGTYKFPLDMSQAHNGFPDRLLLPRGWKSGMPIQFYFVVSPYHAPTLPYGQGFNEVISTGVGSGARYLDSLPMGWPLDREIESETQFLTPNMQFLDARVYHKDQSELNVTS